MLMSWQIPIMSPVEGLGHDGICQWPEIEIKAHMEWLCGAQAPWSSIPPENDWRGVAEPRVNGVRGISPCRVSRSLRKS